MARPVFLEPGHSEIMLEPQRAMPPVASAVRPSGCFARGRHDTAADGRRQADFFRTHFPQNS